jgi:hypothetical protein
MPSDATDDVDGGAIFRPTARRPVPGRRGRRPRLSTARSSTRTSKGHRSAVCRPGAPSASSVPPPFHARRLAVRPWSIPVDHVLETPARSLLPVRHCVDRKTHPVTRRQCRRWLATSNAVRHLRRHHTPAVRPVRRRRRRGGGHPPPHHPPPLLKCGMPHTQCLPTSRRIAASRDNPMMTPNTLCTDDPASPSNIVDDVDCVQLCRRRLLLVRLEESASAMLVAVSVV